MLPGSDYQLAAGPQAEGVDRQGEAPLGELSCVSISVWGKWTDSWDSSKQKLVNVYIYIYIAVLCFTAKAMLVAAIPACSSLVQSPVLERNLYCGL